MHREARIANYLLAALTTVSVIFLFLPLSGPVESVKVGLSYIFHPVAFTGSEAVARLAEAPDSIRRLINADVRNQILMEENRNALLLKSEAQTLRLENTRLRKTLGLKGTLRRSALWARVMERDGLHWYHSLMVNAGADLGVEVNSPVLARIGDELVLAGRISEVGPTTAKVLLVTDDLSSVAAYVGPKRLEGLIEGKGGEGLRMDYLPSESVVTEGESVFTSVNSATFPRNVLIGRVTRVNPADEFLTFPSVEVMPAIANTSLSEVMILKPRATAKELEVETEPETEDAPAPQAEDGSLEDSEAEEE